MESKNITSRHFELPEAFRKYIEYKLAKFEHIFDRIINESVTIELVKESLFLCKISLHLPKKEMLHSNSENHSLVKCFDDAFDHACRQLRQYKDKLRGNNITARETRRIKRNLTT